MRAEPTTIGEAVRQAVEKLEAVSETRQLDAQVLMAHMLNQPRAWIFTHPETQLTSEQASQYNRMIARLIEGEPLPYLTGTWEFYGRSFQVTPAVLIPRAETELLVEQALAWFKAHPGRRLGLDVGTGSGCIAVTLAVCLPDVEMVATDISPSALLVAAANAQMHQVADRVRFQQCDLLAGLDGQFDLIAANLPYIPSEKLKKLPVFGHEPTLALNGGANGLDLLKRFFAQAPACLLPGGLLLAEIEAEQGRSALAIARAAFPSAAAAVLPDLAGHDRLVRVQGEG